MEQKMGDVSGAHFQIITQKGRRKVKLIQRQRKENTKIRNKIHAKASSRTRLAGWPPYLRCFYALLPFNYLHFMRLCDDRHVIFFKENQKVTHPNRPPPLLRTSFSTPLLLLLTRQLTSWYLIFSKKYHVSLSSFTRWWLSVIVFKTAKTKTSCVLVASEFLCWQNVSRNFVI